MSRSSPLPQPCSNRFSTQWLAVRLPSLSDWEDSVLSQPSKQHQQHSSVPSVCQQGKFYIVFVTSLGCRSVERPPSYPFLGYPPQHRSTPQSRLQPATPQHPTSSQLSQHLYVEIQSQSCRANSPTDSNLGNSRNCSTLFQHAAEPKPAYSAAEDPAHLDGSLQCPQVQNIL